MSGLGDTYDRIARLWDRDHEGDDWWVTGMEAFLALLPPGGLVLDAGCGSGHKARVLADHGFRVHGFDISPEMTKLASARVPAGRFWGMDMRAADSLPDRYDAVMALASLLHVPRAQAPATIAALASVVVPGGFLYISVKGPKPGAALEGDTTENDYGFPYTRFFSYYDSADIERMMADAGLETVRSVTTRAGKTDWVQVIGRKR